VALETVLPGDVVMVAFLIAYVPVTLLSPVGSLCDQAKMDERKNPKNIKLLNIFNLMFMIYSNIIKWCVFKVVKLTKEFFSKKVIFF